MQNSLSLIRCNLKYPYDKLTTNEAAEMLHGYTSLQSPEAFLFRFQMMLLYWIQDTFQTHHRLRIFRQNLCFL